MNKQKNCQITFGYADSKYYQQAVELANLAYRAETLGKDKNVWHIVTFADNEEQIDLMAQLWRYAKHLSRYPRLYEVSALSLNFYLNRRKRVHPFYLSEGELERYKNSIKQLKKDFGISSDEDLLGKIRTQFLKPVENFFYQCYKNWRKQGIC